MINVHQLGKKYALSALQDTGARQKAPNRLSEVLARAWQKAKQTKDHFWALRDVSFNVAAGESIGVIGGNGAGKSTLLKLLSRVTPPSEGRFELKGRVASLLEVGAGFHPELSGRENIFLNAAILGMKKKDAARQLDRIAAFAGVERFLDMPVKRYSSGMFTRLAFAVGAHLESEILILDEVFAVGDIAFRTASLERLKEATSEGRMVLLVSHNLALIERHCSRVLVFESGHLKFDGPPKAAVQYYLKQTFANRGEVELAKNSTRAGSGRVRLTQIVIEDDQGYATKAMPSGDFWRIRLSYEAQANAVGQPLCVVIRVEDSWGTPLFMHHSNLPGNLHPAMASGEFLFEGQKLPLQPGRYRFHASLRFPGEDLDRVDDAAWLDVVEGDFFGGGSLYPLEFGKFLVEGVWQHQPRQGPVQDTSSCIKLT
jgi:lipopolysaccharide transport system ATP-binding protein